MTAAGLGIISRFIEGNCLTGRFVIESAARDGSEETPDGASSSTYTIVVADKSGNDQDLLADLAAEFRLSDRILPDGVTLNILSIGHDGPSRTVVLRAEVIYYPGKDKEAV